MSTQQDIYAVDSKNRLPMLNKDNYVPWSSRIIRYAKSRPNGKMIVDSIESGPYVRRMIDTLGEPDLPVPVPKTFHEQTDKELTENDIKWMDAYDQAIQTILLGLPEDVYAPEDSCETAKEIWERVRQMMKGVQNGGNQNGLVVVPGIANQNGTGNIVAARAEGTGNGNQVRCYNFIGLGHIAKNCIARPRKRDAAYLQTQLLIAQKEEAGIQLQAEEFDFMAVVGDLDEIEEVNANCILMENLQHASTSGTQLDKAPIYDIDSSTENDNHVTSVAPSMVQSRGTVETSSAPNEETRAHQETVYRNLIDQVTQVNMVNCNMRATNAELKYELARYKIQEQRIEIKKSTISSLLEEKKKLRHDFKTQEDRYLDKEVDLEAKIIDLENIMLKRDQTVQTMHMLNPKTDSFYHPDQKMALGYLNLLYLKKAQLKQQSLYNCNLLLEEHDPPVVYDSEETLELAQESR
nr:hypothetical protein [Tanacetum cinerariifolium]